jgi:hypothetical protein
LLPIPPYNFYFHIFLHGPSITSSLTPTPPPFLPSTALPASSPRSQQRKLSYPRSVICRYKPAAADDDDQNTKIRANRRVGNWTFSPLVKLHSHLMRDVGN